LSELIPKYHQADQIKENEFGGACGTRGREDKGFGGKPEEKRPIGTPKRRWEDGISVRKHDFY
jgi:hypothetical protein